MRQIIWLAALALLAVAPAHAEEDDATREARWQDLRHAIFGDRTVEAGIGVITLDAPPRALDAATVPVTIGLPGTDKIKAVYITIDANPSPLAATFHFGPAVDTHELRTRVRVDAYTLMHAVAETEDGRLFATERFIKASGGCSAPGSKDPALALERLGEMKLKRVGDASAETMQLLISHPNYNGMQMDQLTRNYTRHLDERGPGDHLRPCGQDAGAADGRSARQRRRNLQADLRRAGQRHLRRILD